MAQKASALLVLPAATSQRSQHRMVPNPRLLTPAPDARIDLIRDVLLSLVRRDGRDLTARQLSAFLIVYTEEEVQTVSSLAERMNISRPGVTRVMDRLVQYDLITREEDHEDRRRVLARRTARGVAFYRDLAGIARSAEQERMAEHGPTLHA